MSRRNLLGGDGVTTCESRPHCKSGPNRCGHVPTCESRPHRCGHVTTVSHIPTGVATSPPVWSRPHCESHPDRYGHVPTGVRVGFVPTGGEVASQWGCGITGGDAASTQTRIRPNRKHPQHPSRLSRRLMRPPIRWGLRGFHFRPKTGCFSDPGSPHRIIASPGQTLDNPQPQTPTLVATGWAKATPQRQRGPPGWVLARMIRKEHPPEHTRSRIQTLRLSRLDRVCPECC